MLHWRAISQQCIDIDRGKIAFNIRKYEIKMFIEISLNQWINQEIRGTEIALAH